MVIVLGDGEEIHGMIEWYDKSLHQGKPQRPIQPADLQARDQVHVQRGGEQQEVVFQLFKRSIICGFSKCSMPSRRISCVWIRISVSESWLTENKYSRHLFAFRCR